jgi:signal peptidase I
MFGIGHHHEDPMDTFWHRKFGPTVGAVAVFILEVLQIVIISAAIIIPIRTFLIQPFYVKGASMEPNFYDHEYLIIDELSFRMREPLRGEIVVFRYPRDSSQYFIKRVVGLPGETIEVADKRVTVYNTEFPNGKVLDETQYLDGVTTEGKKKTTLGAEEYFVLGDNRDESLDSRSFGPVTRDHIVGRVWVRGLPLSRVGTFDVPVYDF